MPSFPSTPPRAQRGFTLLELLVVMAIIGMLASYVGPKYFSQLGQSEHKVARAQVEALARALDTYRLDVGRYPNNAEGLASLVKRPASAGTRWNGPYLSKTVPLDPWGQPYRYRNPGTQGREIDVGSLGSDTQPGGAGPAADISN
jgi:general secretion pathway protein G